jgi:lipopolysaccharide/colanic/teichoic acid biosynthesis glycosyltransferase
MDRADLSPDVEQAARRLGLPRRRAGLAGKRLLDVALALAMLLALAPLLVLVCLLLAGAGGGWIDRCARLGRDGRPVRLARFRPLPGWLERCGARDAPLLLFVLLGRVSFVGPRLLPPGAETGHTGPRRLMAPGLTGPAQRWATDGDSAARLDDAYVAQWSLGGDLRFLLNQRAPQAVSKSSP